MFILKSFKVDGNWYYLKHNNLDDSRIVSDMHDKPVLHIDSSMQVRFENSTGRHIARGLTDSADKWYFIYTDTKEEIHTGFRMTEHAEAYFATDFIRRFL